MTHFFVDSQLITSPRPKNHDQSNLSVVRNLGSVLSPIKKPKCGGISVEFVLTIFDAL